MTEIDDVGTTVSEPTEDYNIVVDKTEPDAPTSPHYQLQEQVQNLLAISKHYQEEIKGAKTQTKKTYFLKKLKKNNKLLMNFLVRLEYLNRLDSVLEQNEPSNIIEQTGDEND